MSGAPTGRPRRVGRPSDLTPCEVLASRPHGTRVRYVAGRCRCEPCRAANAAYQRGRDEAKRAGGWNGLVSARRSRAHLVMLSAAGIGRRTVADISGVALATLLEVKLGRKRRVRAATERSILRVTREAMTDARLVPAREAWALLDELLERGFTKTDLARRLGSKGKMPALQLRRDFVTARNAARVRRLYRELVAAPPAAEKLGSTTISRSADGSLVTTRHLKRERPAGEGEPPRRAESNHRAEQEAHGPR